MVWLQKLYHPMHDLLQDRAGSAPRVRAGRWIPLNLDVDVCAPSLPFENDKDFDGSNTLKRARLERERENFVDWKAEWDKSEDNSEASYEGDDLKRSLRLRFFNFKDVIAEQVKLTMIDISF